MSRYAYIVSARHQELYEYLRERFAGDEKVEVILDRRVGQRRRREVSVRVERRTGDRRLRLDVDSQLESHSYAIVTLP